MEVKIIKDILKWMKVVESLDFFPLNGWKRPPNEKGREAGRWGEGRSFFYLQRQLFLLLTASLTLPVSQVQIHSAWILAIHHLFLCNDFHFPFALENSIPCYLIPFPNKCKQTKCPVVSACRLQQRPCFDIFCVLQRVIYPSAALLSRPLL